MCSPSFQQFILPVSFSLLLSTLLCRVPSLFKYVCMMLPVSLTVLLLLFQFCKAIVLQYLQMIVLLYL